MPQIKRPERKKKKRSRHSNQSSIFYSDHRWKVLRAWYRRNHPLCEMCLQQGISTPTDHIHHLTPWNTGQTTQEKWELLLNPNNLMALCVEHHLQVHNEMRAKNKKENEKQSLYYQSGK